MFNRAIYFLFGRSNVERDLKFSKPWQTHSEFRKQIKNEENKGIDTSSGLIGKMINKFVATAFGVIEAKRDPKWAQPWQTHEDFIKVTPVVRKKETTNTSSGCFGNMITSFVTIIFGNNNNVRDSKYAQPWQTHAEHSQKVQVRESEPATKVYVYSEGILHKIIVLIFGETRGSRDPKFAEPWQSHEDQQRKYTALTDDKVEKSKVSTKEGGIIDSLIKIVFPGEVGKRDPKYSKPWQTHTEYGKVQSEAAQTEVKKVGAMGGPIDKLVTLLFHVDKNAVRDPKYAKPWQTHEEHSKKIQRKSYEEASSKKVKSFFYMSVIDTFVGSTFGQLSGKRDEKWAQPWQTHSEHYDRLSPKTTDKKSKTTPSINYYQEISSYFSKIINEVQKLLQSTHKDSAPLPAIPHRSVPIPDINSKVTQDEPSSPKQPKSDFVSDEQIKVKPESKATSDDKVKTKPQQKLAGNKQVKSRSKPKLPVNEQTKLKPKPTVRETDQLKSKPKSTSDDQATPKSKLKLFPHKQENTKSQSKLTPVEQTKEKFQSKQIPNEKEELKPLSKSTPDDQAEIKSLPKKNAAKSKSKSVGPMKPTTATKTDKSQLENESELKKTVSVHAKSKAHRDKTFLSSSDATGRYS